MGAEVFGSYTGRQPVPAGPVDLGDPRRTRYAGAVTAENRRNHRARGHSRPRLANRVGVMVVHTNSGDFRDVMKVAPSDAQRLHKRPEVAHLTPFSVSKSAILLTKSPSKTHSVSKTANLLTEFLPNNQSN